MPMYLQKYAIKTFFCFVCGNCVMQYNISPKLQKLARNTFYHPVQLELIVQYSISYDASYFSINLSMIILLLLYVGYFFCMHLVNVVCLLHLKFWNAFYFPFIDENQLYIYFTYIQRRSRVTQSLYGESQFDEIMASRRKVVDKEDTK